MLAKRNQVITPSEIRKMFNMAKGRENALDMTVGLPDFETPQYIKDAAKRAIDEGYTKYTLNAGMIEVREALAEKLKRENNIEADPKTEIVCTGGGMGSLLLANLVLVDPGNQVIYPDPGFVSHPAHVTLCGGEGVAIQLKRDLGFSFEADDLKPLITDKTKLLVVNFPNNPTGGTIPRKQLEKVAEIAIENELVVLSDEAYEKFRSDGEKPLSIASLPGMKERTVTLFSFSKTYAMTGWRIGFSVGPSEIISRMVKLQEHVISMPTSISQKAAEAAVNGPQDSVKNMIETFRKRRDIITKGLQSIEGIELTPPGGAFYVFPDVSAYGIASWDLAVKLLEDTGVVTVHGSAFGKYGEGFLRICYAMSNEVIEEAIQRLDSYLPNLLK
ncbi:MAG: pyridoxal phosphate-dependent aminotransferase [Candidatus Thorarchaeota archaeon]|nr:MAG: pyridoxal phosphate-dependent aminotransferase [Candidatus Thorarchaeota archaeon]